MQLTIHLPEGLEPFKEDLEFFVGVMVRKLHTNRHKGTMHAEDPRIPIKRIGEELIELKNAIREEGQFEAAVECADIANFSFLTARSILNMTREEYEGMKNGA